MPQKWGLVKRVRRRRGWGIERQSTRMGANRANFSWLSRRFVGLRVPNVFGLHLLISVEISHILVSKVFAVYYIFGRFIFYTRIVTTQPSGAVGVST